MIALSAAAWKLTIPQTLQRLVTEYNFDPTIVDPVLVASHVKYYGEYRENYLKLIRELRRDMLDPPNTSSQMLQRHFFKHNPNVTWLERTTPLMGMSHRNIVNSVVEANSKQFNKITRSQLFKGKKWSHLMVFPAYALPGRPTGLLCVGRDAGADDWQFVPYRHRPDSIESERESGVIFLPAIVSCAKYQLNRYNFVFTNPELAACFQIAQLRESSQPLPVIGTFDSPGYTAGYVWELFDRKRLIFHGTDPLKTISQAMAANANVACDVIKKRTVNVKALENFGPIQLLNRLQNEFLPWHQALQQYITELPDNEIDRVFSELGIFGRDLSAFIDGCPDHICKRIETLKESRSWHNTVRFNGRIVHDRADGWFVKADRKAEECVSDARVRIDLVIRTNNRSYYRGVVKYKGKEYPFLELQDVLHKGLLNWVVGFIRDQQGVGVPQIYPKWNRKAIHLALRFNSPKIVDGVRTIGWDNEQQRFNFTNFVIEKGGTLSEDYRSLFPELSLPGCKLKSPPDAFPAKHLKTLSAFNEETQIVWATTACVIANILADAVNRNQKLTLLCGDGAETIGVGTATALGCLVSDKLKSLEQNFQGHQWPVVLNPKTIVSDSDDLTGPWSDRLLVPLTGVTSKILAIQHDVNVVWQSRKLGSLSLCKAAVPYLIPSYLRDLFRRKLLLPQKHPDLARDILLDLQEWFHHVGGSPDAVESAHEILYTPKYTRASDWFAYLVFQLHAEGHLTRGDGEFDERDDRNAGLPAIYQLTDEKLMWIGQGRFVDAVRSQGSIEPDVLLITEKLKDDNVMVCEGTRNDNEIGWLLPLKWWNKKLKNWKKYVNNNNMA